MRTQTAAASPPVLGSLAILVYPVSVQLCEQGFHTKWHVPAPDLELWEELNTHAAWQGMASGSGCISAFEADQADWVAATGCDGFLFLWPVLPGNRVPPVVRPGLARVSRCEVDGGACERSVPTIIIAVIFQTADVQVQAGPLHAMH